MCMYRLTISIIWQSTFYVSITVPNQVNLLIGHDTPDLAAQAGSKQCVAGADE